MKKQEELFSFIHRWRYATKGQRSIQALTKLSDWKKSNSVIKDLKHIAGAILEIEPDPRIEPKYWGNEVAWQAYVQWADTRCKKAKLEGFPKVNKFPPDLLRSENHLAKTKDFTVSLKNALPSVAELEATLEVTNFLVEIVKNSADLVEVEIKLAVIGEQYPLIKPIIDKVMALKLSNFE